MRDLWNLWWLRCFWVQWHGMLAWRVVRDVVWHWWCSILRRHRRITVIPMCVSLRRLRVIVALLMGRHHVMRRHRWSGHWRSLWHVVAWWRRWWWISWLMRQVRVVSLTRVSRCWRLLVPLSRLISIFLALRLLSFLVTHLQLQGFSHKHLSILLG